MNGMEGLKAEILREYPRHTGADRFQFSCFKGISCFNKCCADVNIFLSPYDVLRMKNRLGITSDEFLRRYTLLPTDQNQKYPAVLLEMTHTEDKHCSFVSAEEGCTIYADRPWACRMYPAGLASPGQNQSEGNDKEFYFLIKDTFCRGHEQEQEWSYQEWLGSQEIGPYKEMGELFKELATHEWFEGGKDLSPEKIEMFFTVCYNLDAFRRMVFESSFLEKFEVDEALQERIRHDDVELLRFGFDWLKFSLFGEPTMTIRPSVLAEAKSRLSP
jgi:Fe-S-cluster containining protein